MKKLLTILLALCMILTLSACGSKEENTNTQEAGDPTYHVGIIQLLVHPALDAATEGFKDALVAKLGDNVVFDYQNAGGEATMCVSIANQMVSDKVDLIMCNATPALQAAAQATDAIPVLGTSVTDYATALEDTNWTGVTGRNISGTSDLAPLSEQAAMVNELFPDVKKVGIIYCSSEANSKYQADTITPFLEGYGYEVTQFMFADSNDIASVVANACDNSDVLFVPTDNTAASYTETIDSVALNANTPIVAGEEGICKGCGVATLSISYYDLGYKTGEMAYEVLVNGADVASMPIAYVDPIAKLYVKDRCEQLGVVVPEGYEAIAD